MSCVSRLSCLGLPAFCVVVKPRGSQVSPIFEPWVPLAFFQKEFDVSEIQSGVRFGYLRPGRAEVLGASERVALLAYAAAARMRTKGASSIRSGYPGKSDAWGIKS